MLYSDAQGTDQRSEELRWAPSREGVRSGAQDTLLEYIQPQHKVLMLGAGNSRLSEAELAACPGMGARERASGAFAWFENALRMDFRPLLVGAPVPLCRQEMYEEGFQTITNIDISMTVIKA